MKSGLAWIANNQYFILNSVKLVILETVFVCKLLMCLESQAEAHLWSFLCSVGKRINIVGFLSNREQNLTMNLVCTQTSESHNPEWLMKTILGKRIQLPFVKYFWKNKWSHCFLHMLVICQLSPICLQNIDIIRSLSQTCRFLCPSIFTVK